MYVLYYLLSRYMNLLHTRVPYQYVIRPAYVDTTWIVKRIDRKQLTRILVFEIRDVTNTTNIAKSTAFFFFSIFRI